MPKPLPHRLTSIESLRCALIDAGMRDKNDLTVGGGASALATEATISLSRQMVHQLLTGQRASVTPRLAARIEAVLDCPGLFHTTNRYQRKETVTPPSDTQT